MKTGEPPPLMDWMRPLDSDGALHSVLLSTYALSLSDPPFFEQDFLPTLLGLGGVRDRGYSSPANVERRLGQIYCGLVCDAHAIAQGARPSLHIDVMPIGKPLYHAKVVLIHRERLVRLVIASANLTHEGFRVNREAATVLDFREDSALPSTIISEFADQWLLRIGSAATQDFRQALQEAVSAAHKWKPTRATELKVRTVWGGGEVPLWRQVVESWPQNERLLEWQVCSPFWPNPGDADTPFDVFHRELDGRGADVLGAKLKLYALADSPGLRGRPFFPFQLVDQLARRGFKPVGAEICPARLDVLESEIPDGRSGEQRPLHAKWILLRGERTALLLLGSANFTRLGLGVLREPAGANSEVGVLISGPADILTAESITPPVAENGIVSWSDCEAEELAAPVLDVEVASWPVFIDGLELEINWEKSPVVGTLRVRHSTDTAFALLWERNDEQILLPGGEQLDASTRILTLDETLISALLVRRCLIVRWDKPTKEALFPLNISSHSKPGLPVVLGEKPTEQDLLAYFHGRIGEDDLMGILIERRRKKDAGQEGAPLAPGRELQNYVLREFLEGIYGMEEVMRGSTESPRIFEQALLGEFSPVRLATETQHAFASGRRTPTATAFQLVELLRLVENLLPLDQTSPEPTWFAGTRERAVEQVLQVVVSAAERAEFRANVDTPAFREFVQAVLKSKTASRWEEAITPR